MAEIKKYLDNIALGALVDQIKAEDAKVLAAAKKYTDDSVALCDEAGAAASALDAAKAYTDELANGQVKTNKEAIATLNGDASTDGSVAKAIADAKVLIDADIDAVEKKADDNTAAISAINNAENGILAQAKGYTDTEVAKVQGEVDALETYVGTFTHDTAKSVVEYIDAKTTGIATDAALTELTGRVTQAEKDIDAIEADYLTSADKGELAEDIEAVQSAVDTEKGRAEGEEAKLAGRLDVIEADYLKDADKTELADAIADEAERAAGVEAGLETRLKAVEDDYLTSADAEALQTQINTIMNNPDAEGAINSINEFTQYVKDHGTIADGFRTDIDKNKEDIAANAKAIEDHEALAAQTYATKTELADEKKSLQEEIDADVKVVADDLEELAGVVEGLGDTKADATALASAVEALEGADEAMADRLDAIEAQLGDGEGSVADMIADAKQEAIDAAAEDATTKAGQALTDAKAYADAEVAKDRTRLDALEAIDHEHANKALLDTYTQTEENLADAVAKKHEHANAAELAKIADGDVAKWNAAEQNAKTFAQGLNDTMQETVNGIDARVTKNAEDIALKAAKADLEAAVDRIAANETAIAANASAISSFVAITADEVNALFA